MTSPLLALSGEQWESLCDGCGRCCLVKLEDEDSGEIHYTNVACRFLDLETCRCSDYENRATNNPSCIVLDRNKPESLDIMPFTCAYRLSNESRSIEVPVESLRVSGRVISEEYVHEDQLVDQVVDWVSVD